MPDPVEIQTPRVERRAGAKSEPALPLGKPALPLEKVEAAIRSIRHGIVQIIIQDGHIVQIDKTEKIRLR